MAKFIRPNVVSVDQARAGLMDAIGRAIALYTRAQPMSADAIVGCLAFCAGSAIISSVEGRLKRREFKEMAQANVERGMEAMESAKRQVTPAIILPSEIN